MRFMSFSKNNQSGVACLIGDEWYDTGQTDLLSMIQAGPASLLDAVRYGGGPKIDLDTVHMLPLLPRPPKIICVGLNYLDHAAESPYSELPKYPTFFARFATSLVSHGAAMIRPSLSEQFDFEGELVAVVGRGGRHIPLTSALDHVAGYSIFNEGSVRDYQFKSQQWTVGKNFDGTGAFGPVFVTADELPPGAVGLTIETRLNGKTMQSANTKDLIYPVADLVSIASESMTLEAGDIIVTGTPAGIGWARKPPVFMRDGDVCEVEIEGIGILKNSVRNEEAKAA